MRSSTVSHSLDQAQLGEDQSPGSAQMVLGGQAEEELALADDRRAARGIVTGIILGAGAWGMIWVAVSAFWHYRG